MLQWDIRRPGFWPWLCPSWRGDVGQLPSLLGFPFLFSKAKGVELDGDVSYDLFRLYNCEFVNWVFAASKCLFYSHALFSKPHFLLLKHSVLSIASVPIGLVLTI